MKISISRTFYNKPSFWIQFIIVFNCMYRTLSYLFHIPDTIGYLNDIAWLILGLMLIKNKKKNWNDSRAVRILLVLLFAESVIGYFLNLYNPLIFVWGFRTLFRYIIFFLACVRFLNLEDVDKVLSFFQKILIVNAIFCIFQYVAGYKWDCISGLYSAGPTTLGGASGLNVLMCIVCTYLLIQYIYKKISLIGMGIPIMFCIVMASLSEQKAFYFQFVLILVLCLLLTHFSLKKLGVVLASSAIIGVGLALYTYYYGNMNDIYSLEAMMSYAGTDGSTYGQHLLNRTTALPYMLENFLRSPIQKLFGLGLGYGDNVSVSLVSSGFFEKYNFLGYQYFFTSLEGVNIGLLGLALYYAWIIAIFLYARKKEKEAPKEMQRYFILSQVICLMVIFLSVYNQSLILDIAAFNVYFILACPFIISKKKVLLEKR